MAMNPIKFESAYDTYDYINVIGEGGAGRVFEVKNSSGEHLAIKCLQPILATTEKRKRFKNEIDFCVKNEHQNVIRVLDRGLVEWNGENTLFYVMPKYAGTLRDRMIEGLSSDDVLRIFGQVLDGVEAAHLKGVIHRDLKPENILNDVRTNLFVVADFGIAHFEEEMLATLVETRKNSKLFNAMYAAPEQRTKGMSVGKPADIYALGLILNEMFTGLVPDGAGHATIGDKANAYSYLDSLVEKMRQQNPAARPQSIEDVKKELVGRKNEFIAFQELDAKKKKVILSAEPNVIEPIIITEASWENGVLTLTLNRTPEHDWTQCFVRPMNIGYQIDLSPNTYRFNGNRILITVDERSAQTAINQFKSWSPMVTKVCQDLLINAAKTAEIKKRKTLEDEIAKADAKARVTSSLKI